MSDVYSTGLQQIILKINHGTCFSTQKLSSGIHYSLLVDYNVD